MEDEAKWKATEQINKALAQVEKGSNLLDRLMPGWAEKVDYLDLNQRTPGRTILDLVLPGNAHRLETLHLTPEEGIEYGFITQKMMVGIVQYVRFADWSTKAWRYVILQRQLGLR